MNIALIAHDAKKILMQNFCIAYRGILCKHELYATGTTGRLIEEVANLNVHKFLAGHLGGEQQLVAGGLGALLEGDDVAHGVHPQLSGVLTGHLHDTVPHLVLPAGHAGQGAQSSQQFLHS